MFINLVYAFILGNSTMILNLLSQNMIISIG